MNRVDTSKLAKAYSQKLIRRKRAGIFPIVIKKGPIVCAASVALISVDKVQAGKEKSPR
jgi:hypothetical protein